MKSNIEVVSPLKRKISFTIPLEDVQKEFDHAYKDMQKQAEVKGFRKGKVPMPMVKSLYKDKVYSHALQHLVEENFFKTLDENNLNPINQPELQMQDELDENKPFSFSLVFEVHPEIQLKKYKGLKVKKEKLANSASELEKTLDNIRKSKAEQVEILENRPAQKGDVAIIDFSGTVNGEPLENGQGENHSLELGSNSFIEGFEEAVVGMTVGATFNAKLKFPDTYHVTSLAGLPVEFKITLKSLKKNQLPELNDQFAVAMGFKDLATLKEVVENDLKNTEEKRVQEDFKNRLLKELTKENQFEPPQSLVERQKEVLMQDMNQRMAGMGMNEADFNDYTKKWDKDFTETATFVVQSSYLVNKIADTENLRATEKDIEEKISFYIKQTGIEEAKIRSIYDTPENRSRLKNILTEEKVVAFLSENAVVQEVAKGDLD